MSHFYLDRGHVKSYDVLSIKSIESSKNEYDIILLSHLFCILFKNYYYEACNRIYFQGTYDDKHLYKT